MTKIIGITGVAGAGKDTVANAMFNALTDNGYEAHIISYADPIREISQRIGLEPYDRLLKEKAKCLVWDDFCSDLFDAIEEALPHLLSDNDRALLYAFTVDALQPCTYEDSVMMGRKIKMIDLSPRKFMQVFGTEGGQSVRRLLWVEIAKKRWDAVPGVVICPDVRFPHELPVLDKLIAVLRPGTSHVHSHPSEHMAESLQHGFMPKYFPESNIGRFMNKGSKKELESAAADYAMELVQ